jgi:curli biogenesis system outer membrane secretion channel CsgG
MRKYILCSIVIAASFSLCFAAGPKTVGILDFTNNSLAERENMQPLSQGLSDMVTVGLGSVRSLRIVERAGLQKIAKEIALSQSGLIADSSAQQAGKMAGADILLLGSFNLGFDGAIRIDARLVNVETGVTIKAEEVTGPKRKIFDLVSRLNLKLASNLAPSLDKAEKKAVAARDDASFEALLFYAKGVTAETNDDTTGAKAFYTKALSLSKKYHAAEKRLAALSLRGTQ